MRCPVQFFLGGCWALTGRSAQIHTKPAAAPAMASQCARWQDPTGSPQRGRQGCPRSVPAPESRSSPRVGQAEQVGGEGRQHRRQRRITEGEPCVHSHNEPACANRKAAESPSDTPNRIRSVGRRPIRSEQGHQQAARRAAHAAQHHTPQGSALVQAPLHAQL